MKQYKLTLSSLSNLLISSGKSSTLIDTDIDFHKSGFPFIRARTLKGLLKESLEEVCEIEGRPDTEFIIHYYFGEGGSNEVSSKLRFDNLYLPNWIQLKSQVNDTKLTLNNIINYYTTNIQQTAIDENEIAKDYSLRNYRVLNPNIEFEGILEIKEDKYSEILEMAIINLRYAGVRRNRGLGRIRIEKGNEITCANKKSPIEIKNETKIAIKLKTKHPVILGLQYGDQNTVNTQSFISGNQLRGLIIEQYLASNKPFNKKEFFDLFLSGKIRFGNLYFNNSKALPLNIHYEKTDKNKYPLNVFTSKDKITKPIGGIASVNNSKYFTEKVETSLFFHNTREDRTAGKSTKNQAIGGIFYYEAIDEDQVFEGCIEGQSENLKRLSPYFPNQFETLIGKSRSAQYGKVEISFIPEKIMNSKLQISADKKYMITLQSPLLLFNDFGFPECSEKAFKNSIASKLSVEVLSMATNFVKIEQYNQMWQCKSGKMDAYKDGSVFVIRTSETKDIDIVFFIGEWNEQGYGKCIIEKYDPGISYSIETKENPSDPQEISHSELKKIIEVIKKEEELLKAKTEALTLFDKYKGINNNHLLGRLIYAFENNESKDGFTKFIKSLVGKPAGDGLIKYRLCSPDGDFNLNAITTSTEYPIQKEAWVLLLKAIRKNNKKANNNE